MGDSNYGGSTSSAFPLTVLAASTTTALDRVPGLADNITGRDIDGDGHRGEPRLGDAGWNGQLHERIGFAGRRHALERRCHVPDFGHPIRHNNITADYVTDGNFAASDSTAVAVTVAATANTTTTVTYSPSCAGIRREASP